MRLDSLAAAVTAVLLAGSTIHSHATTVTQLTSASQLSTQDQAFAITPAAGTVTGGPSLTLTSGTQTINFSRTSGQFEIDQAGYTYGMTAFSNGTKLVGAGGFQGAGSGGPVSLAFTLPVTEFGLNIEEFNYGPFTVSFTAFDAAGTSLGTYLASGVSGSALSFEGLSVTGDTIARLSFTDSAAGGTNNLIFGNIADGSPVAVTPPVASTPEPSSIVLLGSGLLSLIAAGRRRLRS